MPLIEGVQWSRCVGQLLLGQLDSCTRVIVRHRRGVSHSVTPEDGDGR